MIIFINGVLATQADMICLMQNIRKGKDRIQKANFRKNALFIETV